MLRCRLDTIIIVSLTSCLFKHTQQLVLSLKIYYLLLYILNT